MKKFEDNTGVETSEDNDFNTMTPEEILNAEHENTSGDE